MSILSKTYFHNEADAFAHLESIIWADGVTCPHCGNCGKIYELRGVRSKPSKKNPEGVERHGLKKCAECRKQFTVRVGTVFESSHVPLHKWLQAAYLMMSSKKGISSLQLQRTLEVTYKTAWFMSHRLREAMVQNVLPPMGGEGKVIEADETYIGNKLTKKERMDNMKWVRKDGKIRRVGPRGFAHKHTVVSLVERGGEVRSFHVQSATTAVVSQILTDNADKRSRLMTDESKLYIKSGETFADHESVKHKHKEYVRGEAYTNTIEGYFSIFKRGMKGIYQHCSEKHLHRYLAEYDFRYNNREALGSNDIIRTNTALSGIVGKRLLYRDSPIA
ncbi:MAG: IS1595 family transposase [Robiginitomaculum sp.]|nr:MAG: IS1595 family transposase [Robiginitomaculum sp.]